MGMVCVLKRVSPTAIDELRASPDKALALMDGNADLDYPVEEVRMGGCLGLLLRLTPIKVTQLAERPKGEVRPPPIDDPDRMETEVWDTINYLLTGTPTEGELPAGFLANGGTELDTEDDEGHLRLFSPPEIAEIDDYLRSLSLDDLRVRIDIPRMVKARLISKPRGGETSAKNTEYFESVLREFEALRTFIAETRNRSDGLLVMLN
jgi:hypothetical protein